MNWVRCVCLAFFVVSIRGAYFEIQVVDAETGRGVPLVELEMVNHGKYVTDSAGRAAVDEPGLENETVFFYVRSHGYEYPKDGFGMAGARMKLVPGGREVLKIKRLNIAERLYRNTGAGIYRDSILLGHTAPIKEAVLNAKVMGQDSIQRVVYRGKIYWFWGDTLQVAYPLGNFRMSGATSELPTDGGLDPVKGVNLKYFVGENGFAKGMFPIEPKGDLIWADGFLAVRDANGKERMIAHYIRLKGLGSDTLGRGLAIYNDEKNEFEELKKLDVEERWRFPHGHPITTTNEGVRYFQFGQNFPNVRVPATYEALQDSDRYEAFTSIADGSSGKTNDVKLLRDDSGKLVYRWTKNAPPTGSKEERDFIAAGLMKADERFRPIDVESGKTVQLHAGSVCWNAWRRKWILICSEIYGTSMLGEIWYAEANEPTGPWKKARKIITHNRYSFYNPAQHPFFDQDGGRVIYFEGTYTAEFSGNDNPTARYNYNQVMYRLDLSDPRLKALAE